MRRNIAPILGVAILGTVVAVLYGWHFLGQRQRIAELSQRELGRAAENIQNILQNAVVTVSHLTTRPAFTCNFLKRQPYLIMPPGRDCSSIRDTPRDKPAKALLRIDEDGLAIQAETGDLEFRVRLEKILDELVVGDEFEYLFFAGGNGNVLFQTRRGERKRWIDKLRWADRHARDESLRPASPLRLRNIAELRTDAEGKVGLQNLLKTTNSLRVEIAGEEYRLYLQPLGWPAGIAPSSDRERAMVLGGLVEARASVAKALAVEPRLALALAVLAGLGLLAWPILKFLVLAPGERFKFVDLHLILLSTSALLGVGTIILLDLDNYWSLASGRQLEILADNLAAGLAGELSGAASQLAKYDTALLRNTAMVRDGSMDCESPVEGKWLFAPPAPQALQADPPTSHQHLVSVFWVRGGDGMQFAKLTTLDQNTPPVNVSERPYFREARERHLWMVALTPKTADSVPEFFVQNYRSITTGDFETGLSMPSRVACRAKLNDGASEFPNVAVLTTTFASLSPKALPADYGFMMIDRAGRVLYHSDPRRALREDLFDEVGDPERLRAVVMAERAAHLDTTYRSVPHDLYIRPLRELLVKQTENAGAASAPAQSNGWFIVTFRDLQHYRTVNSEAAVTALVWYALFFVCLQFAPALILVVRGPKHNGWIWPDRAKESLYWSLSIKLTVLAAGAIAAIAMTDGWMLVAVLCLTGAGAMALGAWEYIRWKGWQGQDGTVRATVPGTVWDRRWPLAAAALLLILMSVLPAVGFFKFAWNQELGALLAFEAKHVAETREDLKLQIADLARDRFAPVYGPKWKDVLKGAIDEEERAIGDESPLDAANTAGSTDVFAALKPVYNDASAALRYQESRPDLMAHRNLSARLGPFGLIGGMLMIGALLRWMRHCARYLLLSDLVSIVPPFPDLMSEIQAGRKDRRNLLIVTNSQTQEDAIRALVAGQAAQTAAAGARSDSRTVPASASPGSIFSLADAFRSPRSRLKTLVSMEQIGAGGNGIGFSRVEPAAFLFGEALAAAPAGGDSSQAKLAPMEEWERRRWCDVLERFLLVVIPVAADAAAEEAGRTSDPVCQRMRREALYWSLWNSCSTVEKLVLVHVAEEGFANPRQTQTVERLLRRGLLVIAPCLRPFDSDFERFIQLAYEPKAIAEWEQPARGIGWTQTRWILATMVVTVALFLIGTQRQALTPVVSFVSTLTAAFAGILKLISEATPKQHVTD